MHPWNPHCPTMHFNYRCAAWAGQCARGHPLQLCSACGRLRVCAAAHLSLPGRVPTPRPFHPPACPPPPPLPPLPPSSYFETEDWKGIPGQWWFGGGTDITPNYIVEEDLKHFHGVYKVGTGGRMQQCSITQRADG